VFRVVKPVALAAAISGAFAIDASAEQTPAEPLAIGCTLGHRGQQFELLSTMPHQLVEDFLSHLRSHSGEPFPLIAEPQQAFNVTDAVDPSLSMRRFVRGGASENAWYLWYEKGGRSRSLHVVVYVGGRDDFRLVAHTSTSLEKICSTTDELLDEIARGEGPPSTIDPYW
jgi:hypothetical protein